MQRLEVSGAVRPLYGSLGVKGLHNGGNITLTQSSSMEKKSKGNGNIFVLNYAALHNRVLGSGCRVLSIINALLDKCDWSASRSDRCKPAKGTSVPPGGL